MMLDHSAWAVGRPDAQSYRVTSVSQVPNRDALDDLLTDYYTVIAEKVVKAGMPRAYTPSELKASFWPNLNRFLPPNGRLILVHGAENRLVGCGTLSEIAPGKGELKRLYVRPEANGHGLGRKIVDARITAAYEMGLKTLYVNAIIGNLDMLRIYEKIGFEFIDRYRGCSDPEEVADHFIYMKRDLV